MRHPLLVVALFVVLELGSGCTRARQGQPATFAVNYDSVETLVKEAAHRHALPAFAVGVIQDGKLAWSRGYGQQNSTTKAPITKDSVFRIGSITKVFTSTALVQLVEARKLKLADPVSRYLPELRETLHPPGGIPITIRHLVSHTSGIPSLGDGKLDYWSQPDPKITDAVLIERTRGATLEFPAGTQVAYSNLGIALGGVIVNRVGGETYRRQVEQRILRPLEMRNTYWDAADVPRDRLVQGHWREDDGTYEVPPYTWKLGAAESMGGLFSTVADMARFALYGLGSSSVGKILSPQSIAEMQTPYPIEDPLPHGIGWVVEKEAKLGKLVWHNGSTLDYSSWLGLLPEQGVGCLLLVATDPGGSMLNDLGKKILAEIIMKK